MTSAPNAPLTPPKALGFWMATALVMGNMIGSGVFLLPASLAPFGAMSLVGWIFTSTGAILLALVFARLSRLIRSAGGPYAYTRAAFGDFAGFLVGWGYWVSLCTANAAIAVAFTSYLGVFWKAIGSSAALAAAVTIAIVWVLTIVNVLGVRDAGYVQVITTILKLLPLVLLGTLGLARIDVSLFTPLNPTGQPFLQALSGAAALTLWAFLGLESATIPSENIVDAEKTIPRATLIGTIATAVVYIASSAAILGLIPRASLAASTAPFADAARILLGEWGYYLVAAGAAISALGALNGWVLLQGQLPWAAARDGMAPPAFARLSKRGTPAFGLVATSIVVTLLVLSNYTRGLVAMFTFLILLSTLMTLVPYVFSSMALLVLTRTGAKGRAPAAITVLGFLAFLYSLWAIYGAGQETVFWGLILLLGSIPVYVGLRREPLTSAVKNEE